MTYRQQTGVFDVADWQQRLALTAQRNRQEIVKARLSRREMVRLGLLTAGGSLVIKQGLSSRWAWADGNTPPSPPASPVHPGVAADTATTVGSAQTN